MLSFGRNHIGYRPVNTNDVIEDIEESLLDDDFAMPADQDSPVRQNAGQQASPGGNSDVGRCRRLVVLVLTNPVISALILLLGVAGSLTPGIYAMFFMQPPPILDKSVKAFDIPNHKVSLRDEALSLAMRELYGYGRRRKRDANDVLELMQPLSESHYKKYAEMVRERKDRLDYLKFEKFGGRLKNPGERRKRSWSAPMMVEEDNIALTWKKWTMTLVYLASDEDDNNIFTADRLETVHSIEQYIYNHPNFTHYCFKNNSAAVYDRVLKNYNGCSPPNSLLTYFYPSQIDGRIYYDGLGSKQHNIHDALNLAMSKDSFYWYVDVGMNATNRKSRLLRSEIYFGAPLPGFHFWHNKTEEQRQQFKRFLIDLVEPLKKASTNKVRVLYGGNEIFDYEVETTFWNDIRLAIASFTFIALLMFILTSFSTWLTFWGISSILLCISLTLGLYRMVLGYRSLGILNGAAAFLIVGIGVDDVFVFINTFRQAVHCKSLGDRMIHTIVTAGKATFFTSFTTAAAFAANLTSSIPALHEFGAFMSLIVCCCWFMVVVLIPPALNIWHKYVSRWEYLCFRRCMSCQDDSTLSLPIDVAEFLSTSNRRQPDANGGNSADDGDVPMFELDANIQPDTDDDVPMLQLEDDWMPYYNNDQSAVDSADHSEGCNLTSKIQTMMYHYVALPVIRFRWIVLGVFVVLLALSVGLVTQLHAASRPPLLFKSGTNLQMFMDLKTNLSAEGISCDICSGFFLEIPDGAGSVGSDDLPKRPPQHHRPSGGYHPRIPTPKPTWPSGYGPQKTPAKPEKPANPSKATIPTPATKTIATTVKTTSSSRDSLAPLQPSFRPPGERPSHGPRSTEAPVHPSPVDPDLPLCSGDKCKEAASRPTLETSAMVYVVFGLKGVDNTNVTNDHVFSNAGTLVYSKEFGKNFDLAGNMVNGEMVQDLCRICKFIANTSDLVKPGTAQCLPFDPQSQFQTTFQRIVAGYLSSYEECRDLPGIQRGIDGDTLPDRAVAEMDEGKVVWMAFTFESTTDQGQSYFTAYQQYLKWERLIDTIKQNEIPQDSPLQDMFQTSHFWRMVMMEVVAVGSAVYGLVLSMAICVAAVAVFTAHVKLLAVTCFTILGVILMVVAVFFIAGWELGAVEAVSLSILVGTSVDYCVHLVEAYLLAGKRPPSRALESDATLRQWRTSAAVSHIGVSILSSAVTTVCASIPLTQTIIQPFSKFGQIVAINISVSIFYTLTACTAFLAMFAPAHFTSSWKSGLKALLGTLVVIGLLALILFIVDRAGAVIPGPDGNALFPQA